MDNRILECYCDTAYNPVVKLCRTAFILFDKKIIYKDTKTTTRPNNSDSETFGIEQVIKYINSKQFKTRYKNKYDKVIIYNDNSSVVDKLNCKCTNPTFYQNKLIKLIQDTCKYVIPIELIWMPRENELMKLVDKMGKNKQI